MSYGNFPNSNGYYTSNNHVCGCYFTLPQSTYVARKYLPQAELKAHTTVHSTAYNTRLTQVYANTSGNKIDELRYTFPLYDGVSVTSFECIIGERRISGLVKEKDEAKATYQKAKDRGQAAGLLEQLPDAADVFTTTIGNIPADSNVVVNIVYAGELRHDAEVDGLRYTMPTSIAPRYGSYPGELLKDATSGKGIDITVDISLDTDSRIQKLLSPSHQISISIGTLSSEPSAEPELRKASATLALGATELANDFVLQVVAKDTDVPHAILETHPSIPNQRALMTTLVPKFSLKPIKPEIIFVADRSGSMSPNIGTLKAALRTFLKSLPVGVKFNICSFGWRAELLWPQSKTYSQESLADAQRYVDTFEADFDGTETYNAVKTCVESRLTSLETEIMLLTDGDIWSQDQLFQYINEQVGKSKGLLRLFSVGIGGGVSSSLIEGIARAGNGFSQLIGNGERLDGKIVRMLKGALTPHVNDYSLEINYAHDSVQSDDDFVLVEKVADSLEADLTLDETDTAGTEKVEKKPISLFDASADDGMDMDGPQESQDKYAHLPKLKAPRLLQAPNKVPALFPFSRVNVYVLMSPETSHLAPVSVTLRGTCSQGPLELRILVEKLPQPGTTIHCLAAKKAIQDLEEGRGWLVDAKDPKNGGKLVKESYPARFDEIVEREAVRLGVQFQVGGKWCSFVAVEENQQKEPSQVQAQIPTATGNATLNQGAQQPLNVQRSGYMSSAGAPQAHYYGGVQTSMFPGNVSTSLFGYRYASTASAAPEEHAEIEEDMGMCFDSPDQPQPIDSNAFLNSAPPAAAQASILDDHNAVTQDPQDFVAAIIEAQSFEGWWDRSTVAAAAIDVSVERFDKLVQDVAPAYVNVLATAVVVRFLETRLQGEKESWELVVEKAKDWVQEQGAGWSEQAWKSADKLFGGGQ